MSTMKVVLVAPPVVSGDADVVTLAEAKAWARVDIGDDDALVTQLIAACRGLCETYQRRKYLTQTWDLVLDDWPLQSRLRDVRQPYPTIQVANSIRYFENLQEIRIPFPPLQSVASVQYYDLSGTLQTLDPTTYIVATGDPGRISPVPLMVWPTPQAARIDAVRARFVCGYTDPSQIPDATKLALKCMVAMYYQAREMPSDVPDGIRAMLDVDDFATYS